MALIFCVYLWFYFDPTRRQKHLGEGATAYVWLFALFTSRFVNMAFGRELGWMAWVLIGCEVVFLGMAFVSLIKIVRKRIGSNASPGKEASREDGRSSGAGTA